MDIEGFSFLTDYDGLLHKVLYDGVGLFTQIPAVSSMTEIFGHANQALCQQFLNELQQDMENPENHSQLEFELDGHHYYLTASLQSEYFLMAGCAVKDDLVEKCRPVFNEVAKTWANVLSQTMTCLYDNTVSGYPPPQIPPPNLNLEVNQSDTKGFVSLVDPLTGLYNRRFMQTEVEREISRASRQRSIFSIVMIDLDQFKQINETYGRQKGNKLLQKFGVLLQNIIRKEDYACRLGRAEFALLLPEVTEEEAESIALRIREGCAIISLKMENIPLEFSYGVASYPVQGNDAEDLLKATIEHMDVMKRQH